MIRRGEVWWASLPRPNASEPGFRRPVLIVQADPFNRSRLRTVIVAMLTSNLRLAEAPGNVLISSDESGLPKDSVVNISQVLSMDRSRLDERVGVVPPDKAESVNRGLRLILDL